MILQLFATNQTKMCTSMSTNSNVSVLHVQCTLCVLLFGNLNYLKVCFDKKVNLFERASFNWLSYTCISLNVIVKLLNNILILQLLLPLVDGFSFYNNFHNAHSNIVINGGWVVYVSFSLHITASVFWTNGFIQTRVVNAMRNRTLYCKRIHFRRFRTVIIFAVSKINSGIWC